MYCTSPGPYLQCNGSELTNIGARGEAHNVRYAVAGHQLSKLGVVVDDAVGLAHNRMEQAGVGQAVRSGG
jgi:hypothetical protein